MSDSFAIGGLNLDRRLLLAPMAGVTDHPFRVLCRRFGAGLVFSEFVSAEGVLRETTKTLEKIRFVESERPIGIQIFGHDPQALGRAARKLVDRYGPDLIDINYGCPVPKVTRKHAGSGALRDLCLMDELTAAVVEAVPKTPVTVKMRAGWNADRIVIPEAGQRLEKLGVAAIALHPRTTEDQYKGQADWGLIRDLKEAVSIPVIGNGDVAGPGDLTRLLEETGCDAVMIGRAALGNPWVFRRFQAALDGAPEPPPVTDAERVAVCREHFERMREDKGDHRAVLVMRKHFAWYTKGMGYATPVKKALMQAPDETAVAALLDELAELAHAHGGARRAKPVKLRGKKATPVAAAG